LLVSIIRRYLQQAHHHDCEDSSRPLVSRRLLVCAPTNKAIVVLASRFLKANGNAPTNCVLVGDADKLLENGRASPLRRIFLYHWMQVVIEEYRKLRNAFLPGSTRRSHKSLHDTALRLQIQLIRNLAGYESQGVVQATAQVSNLLQRLANGEDVQGIVPKIEWLVSLLGKIPSDLVYRQVLNKAEVIFCTLSCAGGAVFRNTSPVNDLIVDEAAAATEPEVCIPFHLNPSRVLLVGDPLQLPATILSRQAATLGLAKSLQERLMLDCRYPHVMLNIQYRMKPDISHFPSSRFYDAKLLNGGNVTSPSYGTVGRANFPERILFGGRPYTFLQVAGVEEQGAGGSFRNPAEAQVVVDLLLHLRDDHDKEWLSANRVRVITYYQAQVGLLKRLFRQHNLSDVVVATVDSSQGCESDVVLVSLVRSSHARSGGKGGNVGFLADDRRMNVSLTRARYQLVCIGNARQLQSCASETIRQLATDAHERGCVLPYPSPHAVAVNQQITPRHTVFDYE
jgi:AAA domain